MSDSNAVFIDALGRAYEEASRTREMWRDTRFALDQLVRVAPASVLDRLLDGWLSYAGVVLRQGVNDVTSEVGLGTYRTLLAAKLRAEARP